MEIERKFLCGDVDLKGCSSFVIEQFYISYCPEIRLRKRKGTETEFFITVKSKGKMVRQEHELEIDSEVYGALKKIKKGLIIRKTRYIKKLSGNLNAEIDFYDGNHHGLKIVEVEFKNEKEAKEFTPPNWFLDDVTNLSEYKNSFLSKSSKKN